MTAIVWQAREKACTNKPHLSLSFMLSKAAVIIISACSTITLLAIVLVIVSRRHSRQSTPLPTIQPLAHHRVRLVDQLQNASTLTLLQQPIHQVTPSTTSKPLPPMPPDLPSKRLLLNSNIESYSAASCSTKNSSPRPGVPHDPLSQIEIILPVPLALNVRQGVATKPAIADRWASVGTGKKISSRQRVVMVFIFPTAQH